MNKVPRRTSKVWNFFIKEGNDTAKCGFCSKYFSFKGGSISNLSKHLIKKHPGILHAPVKVKKEIPDDVNDVDQSTAQEIYTVIEAANNEEYEESLRPSSVQSSLNNQVSIESKQKQDYNLVNQFGEDEFDSAGKRFAWHLRHMDKKQRLIAEKICFDVLYHGRLDQLQENSTIILNLNTNTANEPAERLILESKIDE